MNKKVLFSALLLSASASAMAGGLLTNTNQNIAFLRMLARDGAIGIDGVYSNPAGVAFMDNGLHLSVNWQAAWQTRTVTTTNPLLALGVKNNGQSTKTYEGKATAPFLPSIQAAYNKGKWSFQFGFAVTGGGGKCEFANGIGSFEGAVGQIAYALKEAGATGYDATSYMQGNQYYFGFTVGAAYKINEHWSVYGGLRTLYGTASYKAKIADIQVKTDNGMVPFGNFLDGINENYGKLEALYSQYGDHTPEPYLSQYKKYAAAMPSINALEVYRNGVNLQCDQTGVGVAPIIGVDYKTKNLNLAAKYEFRTHMGMKNTSTVKEAMAIEAVNQFQDGTTVREDSPALLTVGAEWSILPQLRLGAGYHLFFDKDAEKYGMKQQLLDGNTQEYLGGIEYDINQKLTASGGFQLTRYGLTDAYMSDMSFVVNSWSFGLGFKYKFNDKIALQAAYFQTNYDNYKTATSAQGVSNDFTRTNKVVGVGVDFTF